MENRLQSIIKRILSNYTQPNVNISGSIATGLFAGAMMVILTVTYASLIFSGDLKPYLGYGISMAISSVIIVGTILTLFSASKYMITQIDDDTAPVFALFLSFLAASLPATLTEPELFTNILVAIFIATVISGVVLATFGVFKFGSFVQFLPYSVMGGYFAAVGWLLLVGALVMLTDLSLTSLSDLIHLFDADVLPRWLPAVMVGIFLRVMSSRVSKGLLLGSTVLGFTALFYLISNILGLSPDQLMEQRYLIGPFASNENSSPSIINMVGSLHWESVRWDALVTNAGSIASVTLISLLSIILGISGLSLTTRQDLDTNYELRIAGFANVLSGLLGGMSALPSLSVSKLAYEIHPKSSRLIGIVAILVGIFTFYFGMELLAYMPKVVLGALLFYIGLGFAIEWLYESYRKFGALEYSVIPIILIVSVFASFLQSIVTGIVAAIILFVIKYSRINIIRYQASGADLRSNLVRDIEQNKMLSQFGGQVRLFTLQGYLFFGTAGSLYKDVLNTIDDPETPNIRFVILDFAQVIGVDSSATLNFEKLTQRLAERKIYLITTSLNSEVLEILRRGGLDLDGNTFLIQHVDVDQGMEWCENYILKEQEATEGDHLGIFERMADVLPGYENLPKLANYLEKIPLKAGDALANIGEESDTVFFLETCTASAYIIDSHNIERRVSGAGRGAIFGEIGFFLGIPRTAIVRADTDGDVYSLSTSALSEMEKEDPELATAITHYLAQVVTERLVNTTQSLRAVL